MPTSAAIYVRISRDAQDLGLGVDRQQQICEQVAQARGWHVAAVYRDNDLSAYSGAPRPGYDQMRADVQAGRIDAIVCVDQDRLTRHPRELEDVIDLAVPVALSSGELDLTTSDDRLRARILGSVARQESERKSERIRRQKDDARRRGWWVGRPPYGYRTVDSGDGGRKLSPVPDEVAVVREMAARLLAGETLMSVARWASDETGRVWAPPVVKRAVLKPAAAGWQPHEGHPFRHPDTGQYVPVVDGEPALDQVTWQRLRNHFAGRRRTGVSGRSSQVLLARLVECAACGHAMSWSANRSYVCRTSFERAGRCPGNSVVGHRVDALVVGLVAAKLADLTPDPLPAADDAEVVRLGQLLEDLEAERRRLLLDGASPERIGAVQETIEAADRRLRVERARWEQAAVRVDLHRVDELLGGQGLLEVEWDVRREVVREMVRRVVVSPLGRRTSRFDRDRVHVEMAV